MKDFLDRELNVGDTVVFSVPHYHGLAKAQIDHFAEKMVVLNVYGKRLAPKDKAASYAKAVCRYPEDCVKVEEANV